MRIVVPDAARGRGATSAIGDRLVAGFGAERVSLKRPEVDVEIAGDSDRGVLRVLDAVERWVDQAGVGFAELGLGDSLVQARAWGSDCERTVSRRRLPSRRIEASHRHGPFDPHYRPRHSSAPAAQITRVAAATAVEAWEDEGGAGALTTSSRRGGPPGIARKRPDAPEMETAEDGGLAVVDAPTALKGFLLALRLPRYRCRNKQGEDGRWRVSVQLVDPESLPAFLNVVQQWLRREQIEATQVCVGRQAYRLTAREGPPQRERAGGARQGTRAGR